MNNIEEAYHRALPVGWEKDGLAFGLWNGMSQLERLLLSPVYLIIMLWMWFNGCILGQDYHFIPTRETPDFGAETGDNK